MIIDKKNQYIIVGVALVAVFVGYVIYADFTKEKLATPLEFEEEMIVEENKPQVELIAEKTPINNAKKEIPVPDLDRQVVIPNSILSSQKQVIIERIHTLAGLLRENNQSFNEWIDLGIERKGIEDYEGARQAWEYASAIRPQNSLSFNNLAVLYGYYLQNPVLAEKNYLKAIENDSKLPYLYMQTADFYLEVLKNTEKAREILEKGLVEIPGDEALKAALLNL